MALAILDGNQSATTLSTILTSGQHIPAHTVVSLGTQAITDMRSAVSGSVVSISNFPATQTIAGTVTVGNAIAIESGNISIEEAFGEGSFMPISGTVTIGSALPAGTAEIGTVKPAKSQSGNAQFLAVDDGSGKLFTSTLLTAGTAQIGSVTVGNSVTIGSLPAISGTVTVANSVTAANIAMLNASVATDGVADGTLNFFKIGGHQSGANQTAHIVHVSAGGSMSVDASNSVVSISNFPATQPISIASVTIGSLPAISGTVTANLGLNELSYVKANINITKTVHDTTLVSNVFLRRIGQYKYQSIRYEGGEDDAYVEIELKQFEADQLVWKASSFGGLSVIDSGEFAFANPQNAGGDTGNPFPPTVFTPMAGFTGTMTVSYEQPAIQPISGTVTVGSLPAISGTVTIGAGTAQIGSVTASISGTVPVSISSVTIGNSVTIGSLPAISGTVTANVFGKDNTGTPQQLKTDSTGILTVSASGSVQCIDEEGLIFGSDRNFPISGTVTVGNSVTIGSLPAISGTVTAVNHQGTAVTTSNFTSTTPSTILASANSGREVLTIFNEGAGNLHICAGATCTTIAYQVRLSAGDYYEVPLNQTSLTHSAVFATAGTARVTEIS